MSITFTETGDLTEDTKNAVRTRTVKILKTRMGEMETDNGKVHDAVHIEFVYTDAVKPERTAKTKPVWSICGRTIIEHGPFDPDREYVVTIGYDDGYQVWTNIEPADGGYADG